MKLATASVTALAAVGLVAGAGAAVACDWHMQEVMAKATPVPAEEQIATPVVTDKVRVADAAILPAAPREEETD